MNQSIHLTHAHERLNQSTKSSELPQQRRFPLGAEMLTENGAHFRVWAPKSSRVEVLLGGAANLENHQWRVPLEKEAGGEAYFSGFIPKARAGMDYRLLLDHGAYPDPASRYQPQGPHGPSRLVDAKSFAWTDTAWPGVISKDRVIYELHIGTFTEEGTWKAAQRRLPELVELGVTLLEVMPVADFVGSRGWGYDGVNLFAPTRLYGTPEDFRAFVNDAHRLGLGVILDVVYNHMGPDGNYLTQFSDDYFHRSRASEWGDTLNFDGAGCHGVRELFCSNAAYWIDEFHLDGLRLDAVHQIFDESDPHFLKELTARARAAAGARQIYIVAENEAQQGHLARSEASGGYDLDAVWNDDYHHTAMVKMIQRDELFFADYEGTCAEWCAETEWGFLYQGQMTKSSGVERGTSSLDLEPWNFVVFLQNHDQIANPAWGRRLHELVSPSTLRAVTAWWLLGPNTPLLFQGQEFGSNSPFYYFTNFEMNPSLAENVTKGRRDQMKPFANILKPGSKGKKVELSDEQNPAVCPEEEETFRVCVLNREEMKRSPHAEILRLHQDLIKIRRSSPVIGKSGRGNFATSVLGEHGMLLRYFDPLRSPLHSKSSKDEEVLLLVNLGPEDLTVPPHPLMAAPVGTKWNAIWCSDLVDYGGELKLDQLETELSVEGQLHLRPQSAVLFQVQALQ